MPNIKSSAKRDALQKAANAKNRAAKSALKTEIKKFDAAVASGDGEKAAETYKAAVKSVDKAAGGLEGPDPQEQRGAQKIRDGQEDQRHVIERPTPGYRSRVFFSHIRSSYGGSMNILFDSRDPADKSPFGVLRAGELCRLRIRIPLDCGAYRVVLTGVGPNVYFIPDGQDGPYGVFRAETTFSAPGLFFYHFHIWDKNGDYDLFRDGAGTNIGVGAVWQLSVLPADWSVPEGFRGVVYYQIFPDRFAKSGDCDLTEKLGPYIVQPFDEFLPVTRDASDFAGGNLRGIEEKLDYLADLGTEVVYLNPIFYAASNHRYDTADYSRVDPMLGTEADFVSLCEAIHARGMKLVLDGVFSHTGKNSVYFDALGVFGGGAVSLGPASPYYKWYNFIHFPDKYEAWWGFESLPNINETEPSYREYILGPDGIIAKWLRLGADGFRLDVADELPDAFIAELRERVRAVKPEAVVIGEVWEDASSLAQGL